MQALASISVSPRISAKPAGDRECRDLLKRHLVESLIDLDTVVLDELGLCQGNVRIDVAAVSGALAGFEIKSPADTLARWPKQCRFYSKVVDFAWLVATEKALEKAQAPGWWGLIRIVQTKDQLGLRVIRPAVRNPKPDPYSIARLLWRDEAIAALDALGLARGIRGKPRAKAWRRLAKEAPLDHLRSAVLAALKVRANRIEELQDAH